MEGRRGLGMRQRFGDGGGRLRKVRVAFVLALPLLRRFILFWFGFLVCGFLFLRGWWLVLELEGWCCR